MAYPDPINPDLSLAELLGHEKRYKNALFRKDLPPIEREETLRNLAATREALKDLRKAAHSGQVIRLI